MAGLAIFFSLVLAFADKKLKTEEDPRVEEINRLLPGLNCGACGFLSCHDFAQHLAKDGIDPGKCRVVQEENRKKIYEIIGKKEKPAYPMIPLVRCSAGWKEKSSSAEYEGVRTCGGADTIFGGGMECEYGCMGFGDCSKVCPFDALSMEDGLPRVDEDKCTGCGKCREACPRDIIEMAEKKRDKLIFVACASHDTMMRTRKICTAGCIACGICVKLSDKGFFDLADNLSRENPARQDDLAGVEALQVKCPTKVIKSV